jgi:hypothetical protein
LPAHIDQEGCPYWYARRGTITAADTASQQSAHWVEKQQYIATTLDEYRSEAAAIAEASKYLLERLSRFWQLHLAVDGNLFRHDHHKVAAIPIKPEIEASDVTRHMQELASLPAALKLQAVSDAVNAARQPWLNNQGDVWKSFFVGHLGLVWSDLMGQRPMNSDPFRGFVDDAWASLGGSPDESFDRAIVKVTRGFRS